MEFATLDLGSDLIDLLNDARSSFKYQLLDLLQKHDVQDILKPDEFDALNKIYTIYYRQTIEQIQMLETRANVPL
jgi:hypothetical protein